MRSNKRGALMTFVIIGVVLVLLTLLITYLLGLWNEEPRASTSWEQPVNEYLRLCIERSGEEAIDLAMRGAGYMLNESTLEPGFGSARLLHYEYIIPAYYDDTSGSYALVAVFDTDPGKIKEAPDAPCYQESGEVGSQYECTGAQFFEQMPHFPFGGGAISEFEFGSLPPIALYEKDPAFPYEPSCSQEHPCQFSVEDQVERSVSADLHRCIDEAIAAFDERGITLSYAEEESALPETEIIEATIRDDGILFELAPLTATYDGEEKLLDSVTYRSPKKVKQLFTLAHGGSLDYVLGTTGVIEAESRDPDFFMDRDGRDILENVLFLDPDLYHIDVGQLEEDNALVTLSYDGSEEAASQLPFVMINRKPFLNQFAPAVVDYRGRNFFQVPNETDGRPTTVADLYSNPAYRDALYYAFRFSLFLDAKDPDDFSGSGSSFFRNLNDDVTVEEVFLIDDASGRAELAQIGSTFIFDEATKQLTVEVEGHDGYALTNGTLFPDSDDPWPGPGPDDDWLWAFINTSRLDFTLGITARDSDGNYDTIEKSGWIEYQYGTNGDASPGTVWTNPDPVTFDQAWPWLILPNVDRGPLENLVYFYQPDQDPDKCRIDFSDLERFDVELLDTAFFPDKNLTHMNEYYPEIYKAIVTIIQEERNRSFGFDQCCPSYTLMTKFRDRGICAPELCCVQVPFLGHEIRWFERGAYNTTTGFNGDIYSEPIRCELEQAYNQIGGDFYPQYLDIFYAQNVVMSFRENLDILQSGEEPEEGGETPTAVVQVLPERFKPDLFNVRTDEAGDALLEDYFQSFAAMSQVDDDGIGGDGTWWEFTWSSDAWVLNESVNWAHANEIMQLFEKYPDLFLEGWTWWDYREKITECTDPWAVRETITGDCVPEDLERVMENQTDYELQLLDPYICGPDDINETQPAIFNITEFREGESRCPNLLETMRQIMWNNNTCSLKECCIEPPFGRSFWYFSGMDPRIFQQYGSWVPGWGLPGTALVIDPPGFEPGTIAQPEGVVAQLNSYLNLDDSYAAGGPFRSLPARTRIDNFQWLDRVMHNEGETEKRSGDTEMPGQGEIEYGSGETSPCSAKKVLHRCAYGEGIGYDATSFEAAGIDPTTIGLKPDGSRSCPDHLTAYELMINGTCRIEDCCFEIAPGGWKTSVGRPGGGDLGSYTEPCPIIPAIPNGTDDPVGYNSSDSGNPGSGGTSETAGGGW